MGRTKENTILKWMTFITSAGDHLTFFAILMITQDLFKNVWLSSYNVAIQALAIAVGCFLVPKALSGFKIKHVFIFTQIASMLAVLLLYIYLRAGAVTSPIPLYATLFTVTVLWQIFTAAREAFSKNQTLKDNEHRGLQAEILGGFFSAQIVGPLIAVFLILTFNSLLPLLIDGISFSACAIMALFIKSNLKLERKVSLLNPFRYFAMKPLLKKLFLLRTLGFWAPISIFNLVAFPMAVEQFKGVFIGGKEILGSAVFYSLLGLGAALGNLAIKRGYFKSSLLGDGRLAFYCQLAMATTMLLLIPHTHFTITVMIFFINGIAMGINALSTQTLRRKLATNEEFVEFVALEPIIGRGIDYIVASICVLLPSSWWPVQLLFAAIWFLAIAKENLTFDRSNNSNQI